MRHGTQIYNSSHGGGPASLGGTPGTGRLSTPDTASAFCCKAWLHGWKHPNMNHKADLTRPFARTAAKAGLLAAVAALLVGCVEAPPPRPVRVPPPPAPNTQVYAYPQQGQTSEQ